MLRGLAAAPGVAVGPVRLLEESEPDAPFEGHERERERARRALEDEARELGARADRLRGEGLEGEADILAANRMMALDPLLASDVDELTERLTAAAALRLAAERHAALLASLHDPVLAARAADIRELGRRAARRLATGLPPAPSVEPSVLVARDLGPADVAELRESEQPIVGIALAGGAATSHAAIMARSLGLPMLVGAGDELLAAKEGTMLVVDGDAGLVYVEPSGEREAWGRTQMQQAARARRRFARERALPPVTRDGRWITLLGNAATVVEVREGLAAEADGIGLLRTELAFLDATDWPTEDEHVAALTPLLELLRDRVATVRVLDFGEDKTPPFLAGTDRRGIELLLDHPDALAAQLRAILHAGRGCELRVLVPLVESPAQLRAVRALLHEAAGGAALPPLGAMIETPAAADRAHEIALEADFFSIGTNDLVQYTLGLERSEPLATARSAADPRVLRLVAATVTAAHDAGLSIEICGESASVPELAALYVGFGVDELSVAPARTDEIRATVRRLSASEAVAAAATSLEADSADEALAPARALLSGEGRDQQGELLGGRDGVVA